nr:proline/serine-rich coiled-coil protein 1 isoform X2 [Globicephala melas]
MCGRRWEDGASVGTCSGAPGSKLTFAPAGWNMEDLEEDVKFIADETLDFGGLSPSDSREEEDTAVSVTPEKPLRRGLSHRSDPNAVAPAPQSLRLSLGPLSPEKLEEILSEANRLAAHLEQCALQERENTGEGPGPRRVKPSPRRETFVLKDSPVRDLLPTVSSLSRSTPSPSSLTPRLRSSDRKVSVRALRATSGKRPSSMKRESPTCNLFPASKSPASSPLARSTPPVRGKAGPSGRATASPPTSVRPVLAPQPSTSNSQRLSRPQGAAAKPSSRLPVPSAIPRPASRMPLASRSVPSSKGALPPDSLPARKGLPRPSAAGHRGPVSQRPNLPIPGAGRSNLQPPRKVAVPGPTRELGGEGERGTGTWSFEEESQFQEGDKNRTCLRGHSRSVGFVWSQRRASGPWNPDWRPGLETARGSRASPICPLPPCPTHTIAKKLNLTHDWPSPARGGQGNEALLGQRTEQTPGLQCMARVQGKERGWGGPAATQGHGFPSECVHAAFGGLGALSPSAPSPDRAFSVPGRGGTGGVRSALGPAPSPH